MGQLQLLIWLKNPSSFNHDTHRHSWVTTPAIRCRPGAQAGGGRFGRLVVGRRWSKWGIISRALLECVERECWLHASPIELPHLCSSHRGHTGKNKRAGCIPGYICCYRFTNARPYVYSSHLKCCIRKNKANGHWGRRPVAATWQREAIAACRGPVCTHDSKGAELLRQSAINRRSQRVKIEDS